MESVILSFSPRKMQVTVLRFKKNLNKVRVLEIVITNMGAFLLLMPYDKL